MAKFKLNVGGVAKWLILNKEGLTNDELAKLVRAKMGGNCSAASIAWYKSKMRKTGELAGGRKAVELSEDDMDDWMDETVIRSEDDLMDAAAAILAGRCEVKPDFDAINVTVDE